MTVAAASRTHPVVMIAAIAVIILSVVATAAIMGWLPASQSKHAEAVPTAAGEATSSQPAANASTPTDAPSAKPAPKAAAKPVASGPATQASVPAAETTPPPTAKVAAICSDCGRVLAVNVVEQKGEGSGLDAVAGGVVGGLLGNQVGKGTGKTVATVAGVAGGAYAGHQVEKSVKSTKRYDIVVKMEDGSERTFSESNDPGLVRGDRVRVVDGVLRRD